MLSTSCTACSNVGNKGKSNGYSGTLLQIFTTQITDNITRKDKTIIGTIFWQFVVKGTDVEMLLNLCRIGTM